MGIHKEEIFVLLIYNIEFIRIVIIIYYIVIPLLVQNNWSNINRCGFFFDLKSPLLLLHFH